MNCNNRLTPSPSVFAFNHDPKKIFKYCVSKRASIEQNTEYKKYGQEITREALYNSGASIIY